MEMLKAVILLMAIVDTKEITPKRNDCGNEFFGTNHYSVDLS